MCVFVCKCELCSSTMDSGLGPLGRSQWFYIPKCCLRFRWNFAALNIKYVLTCQKLVVLS